MGGASGASGKVKPPAPAPPSKGDLCRAGVTEAKAAAAAAEPEALSLRRFLAVYFSAAERALAAEPAAQLSHSAALWHFLKPADEPTLRDYGQFTAYAPDARATAAAVVKAMWRARESDALHIRPHRQGWAVGLGAVTLGVIREAPRMSGRASTAVVPGTQVPAVFADAKVALLPAQALLHDTYEQLAMPEPPPGASWAGVLADEAALFDTLWRRFEGVALPAAGGRGRGAREPRDSPVAAVLAAAAREGWPLLGADGAALLTRGRGSESVEVPRAPGRRVVLAAARPDAAAELLAKELRGEVRRLEVQMPGADGARTYAVKARNARGVACEIVSAAAVQPIRAFPRAGDAPAHGGFVAVLRQLCEELWTLETLAARDILPAAAARPRQKEVLATMRAVRAAFRARLADEWLATELYGTLADPSAERSRKKMWQGDTIFAVKIADA